MKCRTEGTFKFMVNSRPRIERGFTMSEAKAKIKYSISYHGEKIIYVGRKFACLESTGRGTFDSTPVYARTKEAAERMVAGTRCVIVNS
jgi:hypothetical protein